MKELLQEFIKWAKTDNRYPLLFPLITPAIFLFVQNYFKTQSFVETLHHEAFVICSGSIVVISGVLFFFIDRKNCTRMVTGCSIAICGLFIFAYGISIIIPCKLTSERIVVAIVEFDPGGNDTKNDSVEIRDSLWEKLQDSEKQGVPIIAKKLNTRILFKESYEGNAAAKKIGNSKKSCAHLVIWGSVSRKGSKDDDIGIVPYVTVAQNIPDVEIAESQFLTIHDTDVNFHKIKSGKIIDVVKYICGLAYYKHGEWENAIKMCENVELYEAMIILGMSNLMIRDLASSLAAFENATKLEQNEISSYNSLGMVYLQMKNYEKSKIYFIKALAINDNSFAARNNLAITNLKIGEYKSAKDNFNKALKQKKHPTVYSNLAFCLFELNSRTEAIKNWEISLKLFSEWPSYPGIKYDMTDANAGLSIGYFAIGKLDKAIDIYGKVVESNPDYADITKLENDYFWPPKARLIAIELLKSFSINTK